MMKPQAEQAEQTQTNSVIVPQPPPTTNKNITSKVPATKPAKHPGRVASGKALAERNRIARETKKLQQQPQQKEEAPQQNLSKQRRNAQTLDKDNNTSGYFIRGVGGLPISALGVYYEREAIIKAISCKQKNKQPSTLISPLTPTPTKLRPQSRIREME